MRDIKITTASVDDISVIDIDVVDGAPAWLDEEGQTNDQRAALACFACKGTVPGMPNYGVSWGSVYDKQDTTLQLNNELQQQLQDYVGNSSDENMLTNTMYNAMLLQSDEGIGVMVTRGGQ